MSEQKNFFSKNQKANNSASKKSSLGVKPLTPLMEQYWSIKKQHQEPLLFFRMGDFYEMFYEDAQKAAPILGIVLTYRNKKAGLEIPMCGVPHHSVANPISKLLAAGYKVAICDQMESPTKGKTLVRREVTHTLSPGMVYNPETLDELEANYICALDNTHISFVDVSTKEAFFYKWDTSPLNYIHLLRPVEIVTSFYQRAQLSTELSASQGYHFSVYENVADPNLGSKDLSKLPESARRLISYVQSRRPQEAQYLIFKNRSRFHQMSLSYQTLSHLEVFKTYEGNTEGSLFKSICRTKTPPGARKLKKWIQAPLIDPKQIEARWNKVDVWKSDFKTAQTLREQIAFVGDLERRLSKLSSSLAHPVDVLALKQALTSANYIFQLEKQKNSASEKQMQEFCLLIEQINQKITLTLNEDAPTNLKEGGYICPDHSNELKDLVNLVMGGQKILHEMEEKEKLSTQISSLKIRKNNVFGYYIEVSRRFSNQVPSHYERRQTLANVERYSTTDLRKLEIKVLTAREKRITLESEVFQNLLIFILNYQRELLDMASYLSDLDVISSFAYLAEEMSYVRPKLVDSFLRLKSSRHPVLEQKFKTTFVPNDIDFKESETLLITGPNMAGKSTVMRQVAMTVLLAQIGCFVPATEAELPIFHQLLTRIGASDNLSEGLSTFMLEMKEAAHILTTADNKSLVVVDELGRGTSTFDGMSLAQAILQHLAVTSKSWNLFSTHYHELTLLSEQLSQVHNYHMKVTETGEKYGLKFLYRFQKGSVDQSYGLFVAALAGIPNSVVQNAEQLLVSKKSVR